MSWLYSQALVAEYLAATCSDGAPFAPSSGNPTPRAYLPPDRMTDFSRPSQFGMTFAPLTDDHGAALLTWYLAASRAKRSVTQPVEETQRKTFGPKCAESWQLSLPLSYLRRTSARKQSTTQPTNLKRWVTRSDAQVFPRKTWVQTTFGSGIGYLHTPTTVANFCAPSMQKHQSCRNWVATFGRVSPWAFEYLMGWPQGWTDLKPLGMDKCHSVLLKPSECSQQVSEAEA